MVFPRVYFFLLFSNGNPIRQKYCNRAASQHSSKIDKLASNAIWMKALHLKKWCWANWSATSWNAMLKKSGSRGWTIFIYCWCAAVFGESTHVYIKHTWTRIRAHTKWRHMSNARLLFNKQRFIEPYQSKNWRYMLWKNYYYHTYLAHASQTLNWNEIGWVRNHASAMNSFVSPFFYVGWLVDLPLCYLVVI